MGAALVRWCSASSGRRSCIPGAPERSPSVSGGEGLRVGVVGVVRALLAEVADGLGAELGGAGLGDAELLADLAQGQPLVVQVEDAAEARRERADGLADG